MTLIPFPIDPMRDLDFEQSVCVVRNRNPVSGITVFYDQDGDIFIYNFGNVSRQEALWMGEQIKRHSLGDEVS